MVLRAPTPPRFPGKFQFQKFHRDVLERVPRPKRCAGCPLLPQPRPRAHLMFFRSPLCSNATSPDPLPTRRSLKGEGQKGEGAGRQGHYAELEVSRLPCDPHPRGFTARRETGAKPPQGCHGASDRAGAAHPSSVMHADRMPCGRRFCGPANL